jgi:hypothetical protein
MLSRSLAYKNALLCFVLSSAFAFVVMGESSAE